VAAEGYAWRDEKSSLSSRAIIDYTYGAYIQSGILVSSYNSSDIATYGDYSKDLYVYNSASTSPTQGGGADGSDNFLIVLDNYNDQSNGEKRAEMFFADGRARTIKGCYVNSTTYFLNVAENGNAFSPALGQDDKIILRATGYDRSDKKTSTTELEFARKGSMTKGWKAWDLSPLGEVVKVRFEILGGPSDEWGMKTPKYFAIDDIMVEWKE
jgi:hypothetical protein